MGNKSGFVGRDRVTVDTTLGLAGLLANVEAQDWSNGAILNPKWNPPHVQNRGAHEVEIKLLELDCQMTTSDIERVVAKMGGYRLALPEEVLAACAFDKLAQMAGPILCLGGYWHNSEGEYRRLVLSASARIRGMELIRDWSLMLWSKDNRIAVVRV